MILRAALAFSLVVLVASHQPDIGFGRPAPMAPLAGAAEALRCNQSDAWLCAPLHMVEALHDRIVAGAERVRGDFRAQRSHPLSR